MLPGAEAVLSQVAEWISRHQQVHCLVEGHCALHPDIVAVELQAKRLSHTRAENVARFLHSRGVAWSQLLPPAAKGTTQPISSNEEKLGRCNNRRVDVILVQAADGVLVSRCQTVQRAPSSIARAIDQIEGKSDNGRRTALQVWCLYEYIRVISGHRCLRHSKYTPREHAGHI